MWGGECVGREKVWEVTEVIYSDSGDAFYPFL